MHAAAIPSIRHFWKLYRNAGLADNLSTRELVIPHHASYAGARVTWAVLGDLLESADFDALHRVIRRQADQVKAIERLRPRKQRH